MALAAGSGTHAIHEKLDGLHRELCLAQVALFHAIVEADCQESWLEDGARDFAAWLSMRYGISQWKARRWIAAAHALRQLPRLAEAFRDGVLGVDKITELTRFATPESEAKLIRWAQRVSAAAIRHRGDLSARQETEQVQGAEAARFCRWWTTDDGRRVWLEAELPAAQGAVVGSALDRLAETLPVMPGEEDPVHESARRADALVAMCSAHIGAHPDPDRATIVVHARVQGFGSGAAPRRRGPISSRAR